MDCVVITLYLTSTSTIESRLENDNCESSRNVTV